MPGTRTAEIPRLTAALVATLHFAVAWPPVSAVAAQAPAAAEVSDADRELARVCDRELIARAFADATAAGLNPGAIPVSLALSRATVASQGTLRVFSGVEGYRPSTSIDELPVRYECRVDAATGRVEALTYAVVDPAGAPMAIPPAQVVRDLIALDACTGRIESRMNDEIGRQGDRAREAELDVAYQDAVITRAGGTVDLRGRGRGRFGPAYDWRAATFTCRYDDRRAEATRSSHSLGAATDRQTLSDDARVALGTCRTAIEQQVRESAIGRGYPWWTLRLFRIQYPELASVTPQGTLYDVSGRAQYKLDERHDQPTAMSYACRFDAASRRLDEARYTLESRGRAPSGAIATGVVETLRCESFYAPASCQAPILGEVRILRQFGEKECVERRNWIWSPRGIEVWDGCRAEFEYLVR